MGTGREIQCISLANSDAAGQTGELKVYPLAVALGGCPDGQTLASSLGAEIWRFDPAAPAIAAPARGDREPAVRGLGGATMALLLAGMGLMLFGGDLANAIGAVALLAFCALGSVALLQPRDLASKPP